MSRTWTVLAAAAVAALAGCEVEEPAPVEQAAAERTRTAQSADDGERDTGIISESRPGSSGSSGADTGSSVDESPLSDSALPESPPARDGASRSTFEPAEPDDASQRN